MSATGTLDPRPLLTLATHQHYNTTGELPTEADLADALGCNRRSVQRYRRGQLLRTWDADRAAIRLGTHPLVIWPHFGDDLGDDAA